MEEQETIEQKPIMRGLVLISVLVLAAAAVVFR